MILYIIIIFLIIVLLFNRSSYYSERPQVIENFLSLEEIEHVKKSCNNFEKSGTVGNRDGYRNSETCWLHKGTDPVIDQIIQRGADTAKLPFANCESLQVVKYNTGGFFKEHNDSCFEDSEDCKTFRSKGGHRVATILISLSDKNDYEGGETRFSILDKNYKLDKGNAVLFYNLDEQGNELKNSTHGGLEINSGEKWIANIWMRENNFKFS
jgi:prolyl 4-hydroxylase